MSELLPGIENRLKSVRDRFTQAIHEAHRSTDDVLLIAVGKTFPVEALEQVWALNQRHFGENYVQEGVGKVEYFATKHPEDKPIWHFIGPLQSNKTRLVAEHFDWVHSIDRLKIAQRLSEQRPDTMPALNVLIEVNVSGEATKSGVTPDEVPLLAQAIASLPRLVLRGLMAIPEPTSDVTEQRATFKKMKDLFERLSKDYPQFDTLSMGMSADMESAILEGATMVRVGSAIFGARDYSNKK